MAYSRETNKASQDAYHSARAAGHTKEEARGIRDNWKHSSSSNSSSSDDDDITWETVCSDDERYDESWDDDDPDFD